MTNKEKLEAIEKIVYSDGKDRTDGECIDAVIEVLTQLGTYEGIINKKLLKADVLESLADLKGVPMIDVLPLVDSALLGRVTEAMFQAEMGVLREL